MVFDIIEHLQIRPELKESILEFENNIPWSHSFSPGYPFRVTFIMEQISGKGSDGTLCGKIFCLSVIKPPGK